jgi:D-alanyl-D-alanine carboxypeptidase
VIASVIAEGDAPGGSPAEAPAQAAMPPPPRLDLQALREAMSESAPEQQPLPQARTLAASNAAGPQDIAALIRNSIVDGAPTAAAQDAPAPTPQPGAAPARAPSTLNSQANALVAAPPSHLNGPLPAAAALRSGYEIQIGAYGTAQEAESKLESIRTRASGLLEGHSSVTLPVQRQDRQVFRARFVNFDESAASKTCLELRRLAVDCFVMKAD